VSWLSTFVHNNRPLVSAIPGVGGSIANIFDPMTLALTSIGAPPQGTPAIRTRPSKTLDELINQKQTLPPVTSQKSDTVAISIAGKKVYQGTGTTVVRGNTMSAAATRQQAGTSVCTTRGYHLAKTPKLRDQGICVRNRHMNPGNGKAVKRAVKRLRAFHKLAVHVEKSLHIGRATSRRPRSSRATGCSHCR
jgi:hypothetical protein